MKKSFPVMVVLLAALLSAVFLGEQFGLWSTTFLSGGFAVGQEEPSPAPAPAQQDSGTDDGDVAPAPEGFAVVTGFRPEPATVEGPRARQRQPAMGAQLVVVFGEWSQGGWTDLLDAPREDAARRSQTLIGDEVRMVNQEAGGAWSEVEVVEQRNLGGWVRTRHLTAISPGLRDVWEKSERYRVVRAPGIDTAGDLFLPFGARLPGEPDGEQVRLTLPDERTVLVEPAEVRDGPLSLDAALARLRGFREIRYQKGGNTVEAMDAEGLIFLLYRVTGVKVPREPVDLRHFGTTVSFPEARAGDVVFFSTFNPDQPRPVVLLEDGTTFIEATPSGGVSFGRLEQLRRHREVLDVRRYGMTAPALGS